MFHKPLYFDEYLFVYGSLQSSFQHPFSPRITSQSEFIGKGFCHGQLYNLGYYPAAVPDREESRVWGEVYGMKNATKLLFFLDDYREVYKRNSPAASGFYRDLVPLKFPNGDKVLGWVYFFKGIPSGAPLISGGDYVEFVRQKKIQLERKLGGGNQSKARVGAG